MQRLFGCVVCIEGLSRVERIVKNTERIYGVVGRKYIAVIGEQYDILLGYERIDRVGEIGVRLKIYI